MSENGGHDGVEMANLQLQEGPRTTEKVEPPVTGSRGGGGGSGSGLFALSSDNNGTLLVVATLITTLSYQVGSNVPGGYWQDDAPGHHIAGEPIMRTQRRWLYNVFIYSSWSGFAASMGITLALLTGVPPRSRLVRGLFVFSYSNLILNFVTQQALSRIWVNLLVWIGAVVFITSAINYRTHPYLRSFFYWLYMEPVAQTS